MLMLSRRILDGLGFRMAFSLAVILLPLAIVSILRSQAVISQTEAHQEAALFGETVQLASAELTLIDEARGVARSISAIVLDLSQDAETCTRVLGHIAERANLSFVGFVTVDGSVLCASGKAGLDLFGPQHLEDALTNPVEAVRRGRSASTSQTGLTFVQAPVFESATILRGFIVASVPNHELLKERKVDLTGAQFMTINSDGDILTSSHTLSDAETQLPQQGIPLEILNNGGTFRGLSEDGVPTFYAAKPVVEGELFMIGLWPKAALQQNLFYLQGAAYFPLLMWLASLIVGWFVVDFLVTRHVKSLGGAMQTFATNRRSELPESFNFAPIEIREVGDAYVNLTKNVVHDQAELEDVVHQKNILLREVHHRVKNNLQLIASIMSMQMRNTKSEEVKEIMVGLQDRVLTLATIHKSLYQTSGLASIRLDELTSDIVGQMTQLSKHNTGERVTTDLDSVSLLPEQAVPFSLLMTEALTNAFKYVSADDAEAKTIHVTLRDLGDQRVVLTVENSRSTTNTIKADPHSTGLGHQLMTAFATQLGSEIITDVGDTHYRMSITFQATDMSDDPDDGAA